MKKIPINLKAICREANKPRRTRVKPLIKPLTRAQIIATLEADIACWQDSYRECDGWVRDAEARRAIVALRVAIAAVNKIL